jgi:hypothetical protein
VPNVALRSADGSPDWVAGLGDSVEEALEDTLRDLAKSVGETAEATSADFEWAAPEEF